jgi:predicted AAA+ superfamily ATPase
LVHEERANPLGLNINIPTLYALIYMLGEEERKFSNYPEKIRDVVAGMEPHSTLILDEIQRVPHTLSFWRTQTKLEVDFVVYGPRGFWAIEVKRSPHLGPDDIRGLSAFKEEYPEAECCIVTHVKRRENYRGFPVIPFEEFLLGISPDLPIPAM